MNLDLLKYIEQTINEMLEMLPSCFCDEESKGGPGSGCSGPNCGRPRAGSSENYTDATRVTVGDNAPARISGGGARSGPPTVSESKPREPKEIMRDLSAARDALAIARENAQQNPGSREARNSVGRAEAAVRELQREGRAVLEERRRQEGKPKKSIDYTIESISAYATCIKNLTNKAINK